MTRNVRRLIAVTMLVTAGCGGSTREAVGQTPPPSPPGGLPGGPPPASGATPGGNVAASACIAPDDSTGTSIAGTFRLPPETVYAAGAAALRDAGYAVLETVPPRELMTAPSHAWPRGTERERWHGQEHPGLEVFLSTRTYAPTRPSARTEPDSTTVTIGARALCKVAGASGGQRDGEVGRNLEELVTLGIMNALMQRLRTPPS